MDDGGIDFDAHDDPATALRAAVREVARRQQEDRNKIEDQGNQIAALKRWRDIFGGGLLAIGTLVGFLGKAIAKKLGFEV